MTPPPFYIKALIVLVIAGALLWASTKTESEPHYPVKVAVSSEK
jgi:hypothetical protein